jgi:hypothetical protein
MFQLNEGLVGQSLVLRKEFEGEVYESDTQADLPAFVLAKGVEIVDDLPRQLTSEPEIASGGFDVFRKDILMEMQETLNRLHALNRRV